MLQPHGAHRPRESAGVQAALGLCWHHPQCGPAHRGRALSPSSGRRPPLPSACTDRVVSPPTVCSPPPRGWRGSSHVPPRPSRRSLTTVHSVLLSWPQALAEACGAGWVVATGSPRHQDSFGDGAPRTFHLCDATGSFSGPWGRLPGLGQRSGQCLRVL